MCDIHIFIHTYVYLLLIHPYILNCFNIKTRRPVLNDFQLLFRICRGVDLLIRRRIQNHLRPGSLSKATTTTLHISDFYLYYSRHEAWQYVQYMYQSWVMLSTRAVCLKQPDFSRTSAWSHIWCRQDVYDLIVPFNFL